MIRLIAVLVGGMHARPRAVGFAAVAGVTLGEHLGRPVNRVHDRYDRRVRRRFLATD